MTKEEIISMAGEVGIEFDPRWGTCRTGNAQLVRFAALIAAAEREACEKVASDYADYQRSFSDWGDEYAELRAMGALEVMDRISARGQE